MMGVPFEMAWLPRLQANKTEHCAGRMIDRMKELHGRKTATQSIVRLEEGRQPAPPEEEAFFAQVDRAKYTINEIDQAIKQIEYTHKQALVTVNVEVGQELARKIAGETERTNTLIVKVRAM